MWIFHFRDIEDKKLPAHQREHYGIPHYVGVFYAMGWALVIEGVMSACYHICPSSNNFQFGE